MKVAFTAKGTLLSCLVLLMLVCIVPFIGIAQPPAYANSAAPTPTEDGRGIIFEKHDKVKITKEVLDIDLLLKTAKVEATYTMKNISNEAISVYTAFICPMPYSTPQSVQILRNGVMLDYEIYYYENEENSWEEWEAILSNGADALPPSDTPPPQDEYYRRPLVVAILYTVDFGANEELTLTVAYDYSVGLSSSRNSQNFRYYLTPAKYWQDFGNIEINLHLDKQYPKLAQASLDFKKIDRLNYQYKADTLPQTELTITTSYTATKNTMISAMYILAYFWPIIVPFVLLIIIIIVVAVCKKKKKRKIGF